ncbi:hypothetical protein M7784_04110 [Desulfovibrio aminophilus]|nr:hypothetical protein [Desulfovibrio aminophilus]MCM0754427.1 hypothetical protein [Desulfovibrio aminophilus]
MRKKPAAKAPRGNRASTPRLPPRRRLKTAQDLRLFLGDLMNKVNRGEVDPSLARCLGYLGQVLAGLIATSDLEARLEALEAAQQKEKTR